MFIETGTWWEVLVNIFEKEVHLQVIEEWTVSACYKWEVWEFISLTYPQNHWICIDIGGKLIKTSAALFRMDQGDFRDV